MALLLFALGLVLLVGGAELLVRGAVRIAGRAGIPPLVVGLTVLAFGTSAPELAVSLGATLAGDADLALGNVVGSNIFNILFILGASALIAPLVVGREIVRQQVPLVIGISILLLLLASDGRVGRLDGLLLAAGIVLYTGILIVRARRAGALEPARAELPVDGARVGIPANLAMLALGLVTLVLGSQFLVDSARAAAAALGVSDLVIGLTLVAGGTSLPELATSIVASLRGERDIAVGNVVGSNIFNILAILGITAAVSPDGVGVPPAALTFDIPVMIAVAVVCLPIFAGRRIDRWEGAVLLGYYVAYTVYLVLDATGHGALGEFRQAMLYFVLPLTLLTIVVLSVKERRAGNGGG